MDLSEFHELVSHVFGVSFVGILLDLITNLRIFWKQVVQQILLAKRNRFNVFCANIDELRLLVVANIVITNIVIVFDFDTKVVLLF